MRQILRYATPLMALLLWASDVAAQVEARYYVVPKVTTAGPGPFTTVRAKYLQALGVQDYASMDYGGEPIFLVIAETTAAQHVSLVANLDVLAIPNPIDDPVSLVSRAELETKLEGIFVPGTWITTSHSYRDVVRLIARICVFMQRFEGRIRERLFGGSITLDTQWNQLSPRQRQELRDAATDWGLNSSGITNSMMLREILKLLADQMVTVTEPRL